MKKLLSMALVMALILGLAAPAMATGQTFNDVPETYWGYADIEAVAEAGLMNGTGNGAFSPEMKVSVAQFLTLLGRLVFPEVKTEGTDWFGPYVSAAQNAGLLAGTQVDVNQPETEISRYDMAVILRAAAKQLGVAEKAAQIGEVTDYGVIPNMYTDAVLAVYGMGLIKGDQAGNFNGSNTMMRAEVATVIMRLAKAKPGGSQGGATEPPASPEPSATTEPDKPVESEKPTEQPAPKVQQLLARGSLICSQSDGERVGVEPGVPFKIFYTEDNGNTQTLIAEGKTTLNVMGGQSGTFRAEFDADMNLLNTESGRFYVSAEWDYNGVHYVTPDLRTDGNAAIVPIEVCERWNLQPIIKGYQNDIAMVPPSGATRTVKTGGKVQAYLEYPLEDRRDENGNWRPVFTPCVGITVQLNVLDWNGQEKVLGEAVTDDEGQYSLSASIDITDYIAGDARYWMEVNGDFEYQGRLYRCPPHYEPCNIELLEAWPRALAPTDFTLEEVKN